MGFWNKPQEPEKQQTPFGEFENRNGMWEAFVEVADAENPEIRVCLGDLNGAPNSRVLQYLPYVTAHFPQLEQAARDAVPQISAEHVLDCLADPIEDAEFSLGFSYQQEHWGETVFVGFKAGQVTGWWSLD